MSELLGLLFLLALMGYIQRNMLQVRSGAEPALKRYERPPRRPSRALVWVPIGFGTATLLGGASLPTVLVLSVLMAAIQRVFPTPFEVVVGGGATLAALGQAVEGSECALPISLSAGLAIVAFGCFALLLVALGGHPFRSMGSYLAAGAGLIEVTLLAAPRPAILSAFGLDVVVTLALIAALALLIGLSPEFGLSSLGACVIAGEVLTSLNRASCSAESFTRSRRGGTLRWNAARSFKALGPSETWRAVALTCTSPQARKASVPTPPHRSAACPERARSPTTIGQQEQPARHR